MGSHEIDPTSNKWNHPYGDTGFNAGVEAWDLLDFLSRHIDPEACDSHGWHDDDADALATLIEFDALVPHIRATSGVSVEEMAEFDQGLAAFGAALPFTEPERNWLVKSVGSVDADYESLSIQVGEREDEIITAGVRRVVKGHNLLDQWLAWRRQTGAYAGQGTLDLARETLRSIVELLAPDRPLPASYTILRQISV